MSLALDRRASREIFAMVTLKIDKTGAVYTDELIKATGYTRETITRWLKGNGFVKPCGVTSKRWVNPYWAGPCVCVREERG